MFITEEALLYFTFIVIVLYGIGSFYIQADVSLTRMLMWI